jgi:glycosyltransferase involved in cell wall biosynthesis
MKVLHVHSGNVFGGIERSFTTLARLEHLCPEMHHQFALCFEGQTSEELRSLGAPVANLGSVKLRNPVSVFGARLRLKRILGTAPPDVVVSHAPWAQAVLGPAIRSSRLPYVFWLHDAVDGHHRIERLAKRTRPDWVICNSFFTATKLPNIYPGRRHEILYSPIDPQHRDPESDTRRSIRAKFGTPEDSVVIALTSRLEPLKGHLLLLHALSKLNSSNRWECWIAGGVQREKERAYLRELERTVAKHNLCGRVRFLGQVKDVYSILDAADIHCQPNTRPDSFGLSFVEALARGLPVVTTRMGASQEIVDESCGILVEPGDATGLATALTRLMHDKALRQRYAADAPSRARALCDPDRQINKLHSFLQQSLSEPAGRLSAAGRR